MENEFKKYATKHLGINPMVLHNYKNHVGPIGMTPNVLEERQMNVAAMSVFDRLMMDRIIFLGTPIDDTIANIINAQLLFLESVDPDSDIQIYLNSPGGSVSAGLGIYDIIQYIKPDVGTINMGLSASMGAVLLCAGTKGKRKALPHARTMIHQPSSGVQGTMDDMEISLIEGLKLKKELYEIISVHSGQTVKKIEKDSTRDFWLTSGEAKEYGLIDEVLIRSKSK